MANFATLKAALNAAVYQNNQNAITGAALNTILNSIIDTLGTGYRYAGVATPSANPGTIDNRVFYLATAAGTYTNFGAAQLDGKSLHVFIYDTTWHNIALDVPTTAGLPVNIGSGTNSVVCKDIAAGASGNGSVCLGYTYGGGAQLEAEGDGSIVVGSAHTSSEISTAMLQATGKGSSVCGSAFGTKENVAEIIASNKGAHAEGYVYADERNSRIESSGIGTHAEGQANNGTIQSSGIGTHAEGQANNGTIQSSGIGTHAEGRANNGTIQSSGAGSHAEGYATSLGSILATGAGSHAEGTGQEFGDVISSGAGSHAEGSGTIARGRVSHAEGGGTVAQNEAEHAEGKYNASHMKTTGTSAERAAGTTLSSVGCGTSENDRRNAIEVMQNGDVYIKGVGGYDGTNPEYPRGLLHVLDVGLSVMQDFVYDDDGDGTIILGNNVYPYLVNAAIYDAGSSYIYHRIPYSSKEINSLAETITPSGSSVKDEIINACDDLGYPEVGQQWNTAHKFLFAHDIMINDTDDLAFFAGIVMVKFTTGNVTLYACRVYDFEL